MACDAELDCFDIGCYKKLVNRGATQYLCRSCLAPQLAMTKQALDLLIPRFQRQGCKLFPPENFDEEERIP